MFGHLKYVRIVNSNVWQKMQKSNLNHYYAYYTKSLLCGYFFSVSIIQLNEEISNSMLIAL